MFQNKLFRKTRKYYQKDFFFFFFTRKKSLAYGRKQLGPEASAQATDPFQSNCWTEYLLYFIRLIPKVFFWVILHLHRWVTEIRTSVWSV